MKIVAVVVTYNRKMLVKECLEALLNQSYIVDKIVVIDNNSNDGTYTYLRNSNLLSEKIDYNYMNENLGGAGGFYEGIKRALEFECDWVWIMDDDTIPNADALEKMIALQKDINEKISFLSSSVWGVNGEPMNVPAIDDDLHSNGYEEWYKYLDKGCVRIRTATFVSLLFNAEAIRQVGLPWKEFFIWGDDSEYTSRMTKFYGHAYMVGSSKVIHKRSSAKNLSLFEEEDLNRIKMYYYWYRNQLIILDSYRGKKYVYNQIKNNIKSIGKILLKGNNKVAKVKVITKATVNFLTKKYEYLSYKNRFNNFK